MTKRNREQPWQPRAKFFFPFFLIKISYDKVIASFLLFYIQENISFLQICDNGKERNKDININFCFTVNLVLVLGPWFPLISFWWWSSRSVADDLVVSGGGGHQSRWVHGLRSRLLDLWLRLAALNDGYRGTVRERRRSSLGVAEVVGLTMIFFLGFASLWKREEREWAKGKT